MGNWIESASESISASGVGGDGTDTVRLDLGRIQEVSDGAEIRNSGFSIPWLDEVFQFGSPFGGNRTLNIRSIRTRNSTDADQLNGSDDDFTLEQARYFFREIPWQAKPQSADVNPKIRIDFIHDLADEPDNYSFAVENIETSYAAGERQQLEVRIQGNITDIS